MPEKENANPTNEQIKGSWEKIEGDIRESLSKNSVCGGVIKNTYQSLHSTFADYCIVSCPGTGLCYKVPYSYGSEGTITFGDPVPVEITEDFRELSAEEAEARRKDPPVWLKDQCGVCDDELKPSGEPVVNEGDQQNQQPTGTPAPIPPVEGKPTNEGVTTNPAPGVHVTVNIPPLTPGASVVTAPPAQPAADEGFRRQVVLDECQKITLVLNEEASGSGEKKYKARVPIAQVANKLNENRRLYPRAVLKPEVERVDKLAREGKLLMEAKHRVEDGKNVRDILETVAKIGRVVYNEDDTVTLEDITFIPTRSGNDLLAVVQSQVALDVSQRAEGTAVVKTWNEDHKPYEEVESLRIDGWDFIPPGKAGVRDAHVQVLLEQKRSGEQSMADTPSGTPTNTPAQDPAQNTPPPAPVTSPELAAATQNPSAAATPPAVSGLNEDAVKALVGQLMGPVNEQLAAAKVQAEEDRKNLDEARKVINEAQAEKEKQARIAASKVKLNETLNGEEFKAYSPDERQSLLESIELDCNEEVLLGQVQRQKAIMDKMIASVKLRNMGFGSGNVPGVGYSPAQVVNEALPNGEYIGRLNEAVSAVLNQHNDGFLAKKTPNREKASKAILEAFDREYRRQLMNEAGMAGDVPQIVSFSRVVVEQGLPLLRAADLVVIDTMPAITHTIYFEKWSNPLDANISGMQVGEGGTAPSGTMKIVPYTIYADDRKIRTALTPEIMAMARGIAGYDIMARSVAGLARDYARRLDRLIFRLAIAKADLQNYREVRTFETLTVDGANAQRYVSANKMWVKWEWFKKYNPETNQPTAKLAYVGEETGSIHQRIVVQMGSGSPTTLTRGWLQPSGAITVNEDGTGAAADYYVEYADGSIVISTDVVITTPVQAKYVYTLNSVFFTQVPASGVKLEDHLVNLHRAIGQAKTKIVNRHYQPTWQASSVTIADLISNSERFANNRNNPANELNTDNSIGRIQGMGLFDSVNMVDDKMVIGTPDAIGYWPYQPFALSTPLINTETGEQSYIGIEFASNDVPQDEKLVTVSIGTHAE